MTSQKKFAVFDIDGTLIRWQLYHAIVTELARQGNLSESARNAIRESRMTWKRRTHSESFHDYEKVLVSEYHAALKNLQVKDYDKAIEKVFDTYKDQVYTYTRDLLKELKAKGYILFAISGSHTEIIEKLADYYGIDESVGQYHEQKNGRLTGKFISTVLGKSEILKSLIKKYGVSLKDSIAVGDSESDIGLLELVENPIAFNPSKGLFNKAGQKGWKIVVERKNMVYELENKDGRYILA